MNKLTNKQTEPSIESQLPEIEKGTVLSPDDTKNLVNRLSRVASRLDRNLEDEQSSKPNAFIKRVGENMAALIHEWVKEHGQPTNNDPKRIAIDRFLTKIDVLNGIRAQSQDALGHRLDSASGLINIVEYNSETRMNHGLVAQFGLEAFQTLVGDEPYEISLYGEEKLGALVNEYDELQSRLIGKIAAFVDSSSKIT